MESFYMHNFVHANAMFVAQNGRYKNPVPTSDSFLHPTDFVVKLLFRLPFSHSFIVYINNWPLYNKYSMYNTTPTWHRRYYCTYTVQAALLHPCSAGHLRRAGGIITLALHKSYYCTCTAQSTIVVTCECYFCTFIESSISIIILIYAVIISIATYYSPQSAVAIICSCIVL